MIKGIERVGGCLLDEDSEEMRKEFEGLVEDGFGEDWNVVVTL